MTECAILVPTWQRPEWLERCLSAVSELKPEPSTVLVVGRQADAASRDVFRAWSASTRIPARWVEAAAPGHLPPIRAGLAAAQSELVAILDDDAEPATGWLEKLTAPFEDPRVGCVGGQYVSGDRKDPRTEPAAARDAGRLTWYGAYRGHFGRLTLAGPTVADGVLEGNCAWRVSVLRDLHFDPAFEAGDSFHYGLDLCLQAAKAGYRVLYEHRAHAVHHWAPRAGRDPRQDREARAYIAGRNMLHIALKHYSPVKKLLFLLWWFGVGERQSYGVAKGAWDLVRSPADTWPVLRASLKGRADGLELSRLDPEERRR